MISHHNGGWSSWFDYAGVSRPDRRGRLEAVLFALLLLSLRASAPAAPQTPPDAPAPAEPQPLKPGLKFPTLAAYESEIRASGILLQNDHLLLFAPQRKKMEATVIFGYLAKAYDELYRMVGLHTKYKIVVYHLPKGWGGTSECVIEYDYGNLDFQKSEEWRRYGVPHVSGYIEEMAHNFVSTTKAQFGWEMIGWSLGVKATQKVANSAIFQRQLQDTRLQQARTFERYKSLGHLFPLDIEANLCDRIHAHLLWQCEQRYGPGFWMDFFREIRSQRPALDAVVHLAGDDTIRNERYRISVECFDRLPHLNFKRLLQSNGISATVDIKSLHPTDPKWNRRFTL